MLAPHLATRAPHMSMAVALYSISLQHSRTCLACRTIKATGEALALLFAAIAVITSAKTQSVIHELRGQTYMPARAWCKVAP